MEENEESIADTLTSVMAEQLVEDSAPEAEEAPTEPEVSDQEPEVEETEEVSAATEDSEDAEPEVVFQAPEHWSSEEKEQFSSLAPEAQEFLLEKDKQFQKGFQERAQERSDLEQAIEPWKQVIAQRGLSEADAIRTLFATQAQIEQDPVNGIQLLAQRFGVLDQLQQQFAPETDDEFADPQIKALQQQVQNLTSQLSTFQTETKDAQTQSLQSQIDSFKNEKDDKGELVNPHFDSVRSLMAPLVNEGKSLKEAYDQVVWSVPEYREAQKPQQKPDDLEKARKVKEAKKAANAIKQTGKETPSAEEVELTLEDELKAAWKELA